MLVIIRSLPYDLQRHTWYVWSTPWKQHNPNIVLYLVQPICFKASRNAWVIWEEIQIQRYIRHHCIHQTTLLGFVATYLIYYNKVELNGYIIYITTCSVSIGHSCFLWITYKCIDQVLLKLELYLTSDIANTLC